MEQIHLICATPRTVQGFYEETLLGRSLTSYKSGHMLNLALFPENRAGLPSVYNTAIDSATDDDAVMVFLHDDLCPLDFYWQDSLLAGLEQFDIIGLVGNKRRVPQQPTWAHLPIPGDGLPFSWDLAENLSGAMAHGPSFPGQIGYFGAPGQEVKLIDGAFIAVRVKTLRESGLRFDPRFNFHFYDLDFCREAEVRGLRIGTWSIAALHASPGGYGSVGWIDGYKTYLEKWGGS